MKECKKENVLYKLAAVRCMGSILELYSIDRFQDMWNIFLPVLSKSETKKDDEEDDLKPEIREERLECYYKVLGQSWPNEQKTQENYCTDFSELLCKALPATTWKIQAVLLRTLYKFIDRLLILKSKDSVQENLTQCKTILSRVSIAVLPCLGNLKYSVIRTESLTVIELILKKVVDLENLELFSESRSRVQEALSNMNNESHPELKDKSAELLKILQNLKS